MSLLLSFPGYIFYGRLLRSKSCVLHAFAYHLSKFVFLLSWVLLPLYSRKFIYLSWIPVSEKWYAVVQGFPWICVTLYSRTARVFLVLGFSSSSLLNDKLASFSLIYFWLESICALDSDFFFWRRHFVGAFEAFPGVCRMTILFCYVPLFYSMYSIYPLYLFLLTYPLSGVWIDLYID